MSLLRAYELLLALYPADYADALCDEMLATFARSIEDRVRQGRYIIVRYAVTELASVVSGAGAEWLAKIRTDKAIRGRALPDLRMMRPVGVTREVWFAPAGRRD